MTHSFSTRRDPRATIATQLHDVTLADVLGEYLYLAATNFVMNEEPPVRNDLTTPRAAASEHFNVGRPPYRRATSEERLHQARVAIRRLRSTLSSYDRAFDVPWRADFGAGLKWYGGILGAARDLDVMRGHLATILESQHLAELPPRIEAMVSLDINEAVEARRRAQHDPRYRGIVDSLVTVPRSVRFSTFAHNSAQYELVYFLQGRWARAEHAASRALSHSSMSRLHRLRIELKRVQYAATVLSMLGSPAVEQFAHDVEKLQTRLGDAHDYFVAQEWVSNAVQGGSGDRATLTVLSQECHDRRVEALKHWAREMRTLRERWDALEDRQ